MKALLVAAAVSLSLYAVADAASVAGEPVTRVVNASLWIGSGFAPKGGANPTLVPARIRVLNRAVTAN